LKLLEGYGSVAMGTLRTKLLGRCGSVAMGMLRNVRGGVGSMTVVPPARMRDRNRLPEEIREKRGVGGGFTQIDEIRICNIVVC
jgi:hypothetical protein